MRGKSRERLAEVEGSWVSSEHRVSGSRPGQGAAGRAQGLVGYSMSRAVTGNEGRVGKTSGTALNARMKSVTSLCGLPGVTKEL